MTAPTTRRAWLRGGLTAAAGLAVASCDKLTQSPQVNATLDGAEALNRRLHGLFVGRSATELDPPRPLRLEAPRPLAR